MLSDKEIIEQLNLENRKLKEILNGLLEKPKMIGKVTAGPFKQEGIEHFRVESGNQAVVMSAAKESPFGSVGAINLNDQVVIFDGSIIGVVPKELEPVKKKVEVDLIGWDEVGGLKSQVDDIRNTIELPLKHAHLAKDFGVKPSKGMLLYGPPGCGKTLVAKAIASTILNSSKVDPRAFVYIKGAELLNMYVGATEERIGKLFKNARAYTKETGQQAIIFIDEAEAILPARGSRRSSDIDSTVVPTFLSEMDGFDGHNPFLLLSTNLPENIDSAVLREGRIDLKIGINRPTQEDAVEIFGIHLEKVRCLEDRYTLGVAAADLLYDSPLKERVSGAMIATLVNQAAKNAMTRAVQDDGSRLGIVDEDIVKSLTQLNHDSN